MTQGFGGRRLEQSVVGSEHGFRIRYLSPQPLTSYMAEANLIIWKPIALFKEDANDNIYITGFWED